MAVTRAVVVIVVAAIVVIAVATIHNATEEAANQAANSTANIGSSVVVRSTIVARVVTGIVTWVVTWVVPTIVTVISMVVVIIMITLMLHLVSVLYCLCFLCRLYCLLTQQLPDWPAWCHAPGWRVGRLSHCMAMVTATHSSVRTGSCNCSSRRSREDSSSTNRWAACLSASLRTVLGYFCVGDIRLMHAFDGSFAQEQVA